MRKMSAAVMMAVVVFCTGCAEGEKVKARIEQEAAMFRKSSEPDIPIVSVITVAASGNESALDYVGRVEPSKSAVVLNRLPGTLEELNVLKGRRVSRGAVIARVSSETVRSAYDIAKATLDQAEDGFARVEKVYGTGSVTEVKMVEVRTQLEKARAAEKSAREALEDCTIKAPFSGVVGEVFCQQGEHVDVAAPLVQLLDVESVEIHFNVPEAEYSRIQIGDTAEVEVKALGKVVSGTVAVKGVTASPLSHSYDFTIKGISDAVSLMPGMVCKVSVKSEGEDVFVISASSVKTDMEGRYVWAVGSDDTVCKKYVTVGGYAGSGVVITEGLEEGDRVIVEGSRKVSTGMKVKTEER